jgi:hypothetical protein
LRISDGKTLLVFVAWFSNRRLFRVQGTGKMHIKMVSAEEITDLAWF